jgi:hypothetical protein
MQIKEFYTKVFLKAANQNPTDELIKEKSIEWWFNQRSKQVGGLRLTRPGIDFLLDQTEIKIYEIDLPEEIKQIPQLLVWLDKFIETPYFIEKKKIIVTNERLAVELYLFSGDVMKFGYVKAVKNRMSKTIIDKK